jgi:hypothetical protein
MSDVMPGPLLHLRRAQLCAFHGWPDDLPSV